MVPIRRAYDGLADEYARHIFNELRDKPLDRKMLDRFAQQVCERGKGATWDVAPVKLRGTYRNTESMFSGWIYQDE
jgi:hypothetical protein